MNQLFTGINPTDLSTLLTCLSAREIEYKKDTYIWKSGDKTGEIGLILSGSAYIIKEDFWGNRAIISNIEKEELFGEAFACGEAPFLPVSVVTAEKSSILFLHYKKIVTTCSSTCTFHSKLIRNMLLILAKKNISLMQKMDHMIKRTTREKLLSYLSEQAMQNKCSKFQIPFNRQELADFLSVDRSAMSNELGKLRDEGTLNFHKNSFELIHPQDYDLRESAK